MDARSPTLQHPELLGRELDWMVGDACVPTIEEALPSQGRAVPAATDSGGPARKKAAPGKVRARAGQDAATVRCVKAMQAP